MTRLNLPDDNWVNLWMFCMEETGLFCVFPEFKDIPQKMLDLSTKQNVSLKRWQAGKNREGILPPPAGYEFN
jgi:hypothetical protein